MSSSNQSSGDLSNHSRVLDLFPNGFETTKFYRGDRLHDSLSIVYKTNENTEKRVFVPITNTQLKAEDIKLNKLDEEPSQNAFGRIFARFADKTSMLGVNYIATSKLMYAKVFWVLLTVAALVLSILHMYILIDLYYEYPKQTKLSLGFSPLHMPAVTICNANPIRKSKLDLIPDELKALMDKLEPENIRKKKGITFEEAPLYSDYDIYDIDWNITDDEYEYWEEYYDPHSDAEIGARDVLAMVREEFRQLYGDMNSDDRFQAGHQLDDMMIRCTIKGRRCSSENFTMIPSMDYGNCFTLQSDKYILDESGPDGGLTMVLYMEDFDYIEGFSSGNGMRVAIHEISSTPFPHEEGLYVSAGQETNIGLRMREISRLGDPFGKCETGESFQRQYGIKYTRQTCQYFCAETKIHEICKCYRRDEDDILLKMKITSKKKWCSTKSELKCLYRTESLLISGNLTCECLSPCREFDFPKALSSISWPSYKYAQLLTETVCEKAGEHSDACQDLDGLKHDRVLLRENFLKLNIYFESLNFEKVEESQDYEDIQFLSDVGGAVGLWIGLSVLSIFELGQLLVEIFDQVFYKQTCRYRKPPSS